MHADSRSRRIQIGGGGATSRPERRGTTRVLADDMRRLYGLVMVSILAQGCVHGVVNGTSTAGAEQALCDLSDPCGGTGQADGIVSAVVAGAMVGTIMVALYRRFIAGA